MTEMYAFIVAFSAQVFVVSVLGPRTLATPLRNQIAAFIDARRPAIDAAALASLDRKLQLFRTLSWTIALLGVLLLLGMIRYMQRPDWTDGPLEAVVPAYWLLQVIPHFLALVVVGRFHGALKRSLPPEKRTALLQPRGLFDFVPRALLVLAALVYASFIGLLVYIERHPFPGFAGIFINAMGATLIYAMMALAIYLTLRRMGSSPLQRREERMRSVGLAVRVCVFMCILTVAGLALNMTLILMDEQRWEPTFGCLSLLFVSLLARLATKSQMGLPEDVQTPVAMAP